MKRLATVTAVLFMGILGGVCQLAAQTADIGQLTLTGPHFGYQTVSLYNYTGATNGCEQLAAAYNVCNAVNIASWQLTITFTSNASGLPTSPLVFSSNGASDSIAPTNSNFTAYTGEATNPWSLSFDLSNAGCSPSCDAQISSITFSGTLDTGSLELYNGSASGPYSLDALNSQTFTVTWNIPATDYTANPDTIYDATDLVISNQTPLTSQTITFGALADQVLGTTPPALSASATSSLPVTFVSNSSPICTVSGTAITLVSAGVCSITANQTGNATYSAATPVTQTFNVTLEPQTITFGPLTTQTLGTPPPALSATASSNLTVSFGSNSPSVCTVSTTTITLVGAGTCSITATQLGNSTFAAAAAVTQTFTVNLTPQTISFGTIPTQTLGTTPPVLGATATSGLTVSYISNSTSICTVSGTAITLASSGTCSITASQPGDSITWAAASSVTQTFNVLGTQTISFGTLPTQTIGATVPALSATATSGLTVTYVSKNTSVCTVSVATITLLTTGTCSITASQSGNGSFAAAPSVTQTFLVSALTSQSISFGALSALTLGSSVPPLNATATSTLAVTYVSNNTAVCTVSGVNITLQTVGTCSITASQSGNSTYAAATPVTQTFAVLNTQTITFGPLTTQTLGTTPPALSATATSGLAVAFSSNSASICTVSGTAITLVTGGTCSITASQPGNGTTYAAATSITQTFTVLLSQSINFGTLSTQNTGSTVPPLNATATSGLVVSYISNNTSVCTVSGVNITLVTTGTCSITASQAGNGTYAAAPSVTQTFLVSTLTPQTITFGTLPPQTPGATVPPLSATATSALTVTFASNNTSVCTVNGVTVTLIGTGVCSITATQGGNGTYAPATPVTQTFTVLNAQTISFPALTTQAFGTTPPALSATATSGLPVTFVSNNTAVCTVSGTAITLVGVGTCSITAIQSGNSTAYSAATPVTQTFTVSAASQTITFGPLTTQAVGVQPPALSAGATSGLAVTFTSNSTSVCTVSGTAITLLTGGTCSITASQPGNGTTYAAATPVTQTFTVLAAQTITFGPLSTQTLGNTPPALGATASSGLAVTYVSNSQSICTVSGTAISLAAVGTCSITASQAGNGTYAAATPVTQTFLVSTLTSQSITFGTLTAQAFGATPPALGATATSGLAVSYLSNSPSICTLSGTAITLVNVGTCSITASQTGNSTFAPATPITQTFAVNQGLQTINFGTISAVTLPASAFTLTATATSGLAVSYASTTTSICTVSGSSLTPVAAGTCSITASQPGSTNWAAASPVVQSFTINPASSGGGGGGGGGVGGGNPLSVAPASVTINAAVGGATASQTVTLSYVTETQGAPTYSSNFNTNQGQGWLSVSPASGTMTQASFANFLYTYTATVTISANPAGIAAGSADTGTVNFASGNGVVSVPVTLNVSAQATKYVVAPQALTFTYQQGSSTLPQVQGISVFSSPAGGSFTASASSTGNWLSVPASAAASAATPGTVAVSVNVAGLAPATYTGSITVSTGTSGTIAVPVTLTVTPAAAPVMVVTPSTFSVTVPQGNGGSSGQNVIVSNAGGGTLQFSVQATSAAGWLTLAGPTTGSATPGSPSLIPFTISPSSLSPGTYNGNITVSQSNSSVQSSVAVVLVVTKPAAPSIDISKDGLTFTAVAGGSSPPAQTFIIVNDGAGPLNWTAQTSTTSGGNWLSATASSGTIAVDKIGPPVSVSVNTSGLAAGQYYGSVNVADPNATDTPQTVSVALTVLAAATGTAVTPSTNGVILYGFATATAPVTQTLTLYNQSAASVAYSASTFTANGASWLSASPATGSAAPGASSFQILANLSGLSGLQTGTVTLSFADGGVATIQVIAFAIGGGSAVGGAPLPADLSRPRPATLRPLATSACPGGKPSFLVPLFAQPASQSTQHAAVATTIQLQVIDDCGNAVTAASGGSVQVAFSSGDPSLNLNDTGSGFWEATWTPVNAAAAVVLQPVVSENSLAVNPSINTSLTVAVLAATATSAPQPTGIANAASAGQATPQLVSPGSYIAIYGTGLAGSGNPNATSLPLPTTLNGTQLLLGGIPMPLLYAAPGQVNALVPQGIVPNATYPLVIVRGTAQSVPVPVTVTELQPGTYTVDTSGSGAGVVTNASTGNLITSSNPAHAQDYLVVYATGLGVVAGPSGQQQPGDGVAAPTNLIYYTNAKVTATIGGVSAPVVFSGLTPTLSALYQVNVQVPAGVTPGAAVPLVITATDPATGATAISNKVTINVQ